MSRERRERGGKGGKTGQGIREVHSNLFHVQSGWAKLDANDGEKKVVGKKKWGARNVPISKKKITEKKFR